MKLNVDVNEVVLSNVGAQGEFRIRNSAKAFKILSDGLYSNKIRAVIRELSCNAVDSHVGAGKADVPFEVHLPSFLEPWFSVRDFGLGLSGDAVVNIYTTYFESTKTDSNAYIGALGLGSKSPFSYTENFTVTAIKDGSKRIYSAFINEMGVPSIAEMSNEDTTEGNGVEVKFSVVERHDYNSFRTEAQNVFQWFKIQPNVIGDVSYTPHVPTYKEMNIIPGVHIKPDPTYGRDNRSMAVMGNIAYPLDKMPEPSKHMGVLAELLNCGLVMEFDIGELDFAASREELSYVPSTLQNIKKKLTELNANLSVHLTKKADEITCEWERAAYLSTEYRTRIYKAAVAKYVTDTKFELFDIQGYHGQKKFQYLNKDLIARNLSIVAFHASNSGTSKIGESHITVNGSYEIGYQIPVSTDVVIVLNDLKTGIQARARYHFANHNNNKTTQVFCISHTDADVAVRDIEYQKLLKELHNPPTVVKASTLQKQVRAESMASTGIMKMRLKTNARPGYADSYMWAPYHEEIDESKTYNFVYLNNQTAIKEDDSCFNMARLKSMMDESGVTSISNIEVFGVRKSRAKEISEYDNWVWIEEIIRKEAAKISDEHIVSLMASELLDTYYERVYTNHNVAKLVGPDSYYHKFVKEIGGIKRSVGNVTSLANLCSEYGTAVKVDAIKTKIKDAKALLYKKYPFLVMLRHDTSTMSEADVAAYIIMVDKQEKTNE